jgi:hypothetical protein
MIGGFIETKYDISSSGKNLLWDVDETLTGGKGVGDIRTGEEKAQYIVNYTIDSKLTQVPVKKDTSEDKIKDGEASETVSGENERYVVTLTDDKGNKQEQVVDKFPATIEDKSGAVYEVDKEGNIKQVSSKSDIRLDDNTKYKQDTTVVSVRFEETDNTRYALDVYTGTYNKVTEYEREYIVSETEPIRTSAKLMLPDTSDEIFVRAIANDKGFDPAKVHFVTESRTEYKAEYDSQKGGWTLSLVAPPANDGQLVYAVYDKGNGQYGTLAILKVLTYEPKEVNVMLVPVNGEAGTINEGALQEEVNAIYNKFGVTVNLKVSKEEFRYTPIDGTFQIDGTGLFDTRTADMDALEAAFRKTGKYNDQTVYLFVMDKPSNVPDVKGDMPRDSRMGYLFPSYDARTIAHEIGHGVFNLKHPFAKGILTNQFNKGELKDNLMDYPAGMGLAKLQWDALHSPGIVIGLFEKDGDAMSIQTNAIPREFADNGYLNFLTPTGKKITLPENCVATFKYGITTSSSELRSTIGYLESFKIIQDGEVMEYTCSIVNNNFTGYYDTKTKATYLDEYTDQNTQSNAVTVVLTTTGLRFVKVNVSDLKPYKINEPVVEYDLFPVLPYKTGNIIKTSEETSYSDIKNLTASRGEDWSLNREYLSSMLKGHENKPEYGYVVKIVELRTAYRGLFDSFTVYFDKWNEIKTEETILNRQTGYYDVVRYNLSQWDKLYVTDTSLQSLWKNDPAGYYKQFVNAFIDYIESAANTKQDFLSTLSLSTRPKEASDFLSLCSNDELSDIPWEKREILLRVLASESIVGNALEKNIIRLVKYIPQADISSLLNALKTQKDAKGKDQLLYCFMGKTINDLNGEEFYSFAGIIHSYLNEQYQYDRSPSAIGLNKRENRYFSFDPSFWTSKPIVIEMNGDGSIRFTLRKQFTVMQYDPVILQDPYASVTLHFEDDKTSGEFGFKKNQVYTTSGLMAYAICYSILKDNAKIGGFVVLNTALMATGIGELNAALQAGRTGAAVLAGTDIALGIGYIVVDTGYRDRWQQTEDGRTVLKFWDGVNLLYAGGRITQALYNSAQAAKTSANTLRNSADDAERAILEETEQQADDVIARFNVENFVGKNVNQQYAEIANVWKSKYPIEEMLEGRTFFERLMGEYRYTKTAGWGHTADIAHNFKGVDFYKGFTEIGDRIFSETAVSMKTTITKSVDDWLKINKGNIDVLTQSMGNGANNGIKWNGKTLFYNKAELHIYVPKENLTPEFKSEWINKLSNYNSNVTYQINAIEDFIK